MIPFREWPDGKPFEMRDTGGKTRYGVKFALVEYYEDDAERPGERRQARANAFFFDTNALEMVSHNKKVSEVRTIKGRLARTHDNALIVVKPLQKGIWAAYYVNLANYQTMSDAEIELIPVEVGERRDEVDIIMTRLRQSLSKTKKLFELLELELIE